MSHSDMAITEQQKEEFFQTMRESADYKFGYCRSAITTAVWLLELGKPENALSCLKSCLEMMKDKPDAR